MCRTATFVRTLCSKAFFPGVAVAFLLLGCSSSNPPPAPELLSATAGFDNVNVAWTAVPDATSYNLYWAEAPDSIAPKAAPKVRDLTKTTYLHLTVTAGKTYTYAVTAVNGDGESPRSNLGTATLPPATPSMVSIAGGDKSVALDWTDVPLSTSYNIYWSQDPGVTPATGTKISGMQESSYLHSGLDNGEPYYYVVTAVGPGGESLPSAVSSVHLKPDPTVLLFATPGDGTVELGWMPVPGATSYNVYWSKTAGVTPQTGTLIEGIQTVTYTHVGLTNADTYHYIVTVVGPGGESVPSSEVSATLAPSATDLISVTAEDAHVHLQWADVYGATSYNLYWSNSPGVTPANGTKISGLTATVYEHTGLTNWIPYYYVVTAVGAGGESALSTEVSATPYLTPGAPIFVTVTATEEVPNSLTVSWQAPSTGADTYNIYWATQPGVTKESNVIPDATSPYEHTGLEGRTTYYYAIAAVLKGEEGPLSAEVSATARGPRSGAGGGGGGGEPTGFGNNLSLPLVFADGYGVAGAQITGAAQPWLDTATGLRPTATDTVDPFPYFDPADAYLLNELAYFQQQGASTWQADWRNATGNDVDVVLDWGDNLASVGYSVNSVIRVETALYQDTSETAPTDTMTAYNMQLLYGSGTTEMWGTDGSTFESNRWNVFAAGARLTIEKLVAEGGAVDASVPAVSLSVAEGFDATSETDRYGAEINVSGKLVYGYVWRLRQSALTAAEKEGWWRITFSLDASPTVHGQGITNRTHIVTLDGSDPTATIDQAANSSSIEIYVGLTRSGEGGGGGGGGGGS